MLLDLYDELSRLTEVRNNGTNALIEANTYDPLNNRTSKTDGVNAVYYLYDAANQLKEIRQGSPTGTLTAGLVYDQNGSMTKKCEGGTVTASPTDCTGATTTALSYDALNRMTQAAKTGISTQTYGYDDQDRRIRKTVGATATNFLYSGPDIHAEYTSWTAANAIYTHGPGMDDPILRQAGATAQYYHQDGLGSVVAMSDQSGATLGTQRFDAWGNKIAATGAIPQYGYTGREPDETGLVYYRARYYDPAIGRFVSRDPIGIAGGINPYAYVANNPTNLTDPLGLKAVDPQTAQFVQANLSYVNNSTPGMSAGKPSLLAYNDGIESDEIRTDVYTGPKVSGQGGGESGNGYSGWRGPLMKLGEALFGPSVDRMIDNYSQVINQAASQHNVAPSLIKAIVYEEQTHTIPVVEYRRMEGLGFGNTVGLGQVTVGYYGYTRKELLDPETNINVIGLHLKTLRDKLVSQGVEPTPERLGTLYNCGSCKETSDYGRRIKEFYQRFETSQGK